MAHTLALITHYYPAHRGGVELVAEHLARLLTVGHGTKVRWLASDIDPAPADLPDGMTCEAVRAWNVTERLLGVPFPFWGAGAVRRLWWCIGRADVVHLHDALYPGNVLAFLIAGMRRVPVVVTQHVGAIPYRSAFLRTLLALLNRTVARLVLSRAAQVVFISRSVEGYFGSFCHYRTPPKYIANGVDSSVFHSVSTAERVGIRSALGIEQGRFVHLFVGRFVEKKGLPMLRELARAFPDDLWILAGRGHLDPGNWGLPNVRVVGGESGASLARYYQAADLLVLPSWGEGFPLVVQEAMACGTPVIVGEDTADGCPAARPLLFVESVAGSDAQARWVARIANLRAAASIVQQRRTAVAEFARQHWSWEAAAAAYAAMMDGLAASSAEAVAP